MALTLDSRPNQVVDVGGTNITSRWNAVTLPIQYGISTNLFPTNSLDSSTNIISVTSLFGFARLNLSAPITLSGFLRVSGTDDYDGVYAVDVTASTTVTLPVPFVASDTGTVIREYRNMKIEVDVYEGFPAGHEGASARPLTKVAQLAISPDSDNEIIADVAPFIQPRFSSDAVIDYDDTTTSRLDRWTAFYIVYREAFDTYSDADGFGRTTQNEASDNSNPQFAVNAARQFQDISSFDGSMEVYPTITSAATGQSTIRGGRWLTMFEEPVAFEGWPFELSIILDESVRDKWDGTETEIFIVATPGGPLSPIESFAGDETYGIRAYQEEGGLGALDEDVALQLVGDLTPFTFSEAINIKYNNDCSNQDYYLKWLNPLGGVDQWLFTAEKDYTSEVGGTQYFQKSVEGSWTSGPTYRGIYQRETKQRITVRSQFVTLPQLLAIQWVRYSPRVRQVASDGTETTVLPVDGSFTVYRDGLGKLYSISFEVELTAPLLTQKG